MGNEADDRDAGGDSRPGGTAVVFLTHELHDHYVARYRRLRRSVPPDHDLVLAFDATTADRKVLDEVERLAGENLYPFRFPELSTEDYPGPWAADNDSRLVPGNNDLLLLHLHRTVGEHDRYWMIENDVEYTGDWRAFFEHFRGNESDLLGTTLQPYSVLPEFHWWSDLDSPNSLAREDLYRGFFPVVRVNRRGLRELHRAYSEGWSGHHEVVLPTALLRRGAEIEDIGGEGPFVRPGNENRFYTNTPGRTGLGPGTFIYRPPRRWAGLRRDKLWHPVKPTQGRIGQYTDLVRDWLEARLPTRRG